MHLIAESTRHDYLVSLEVFNCYDLRKKATGPSSK